MSSSAAVSIHGINKVKLLHALWMAAPSAQGTYAASFDEHYAAKRIASGYIGFFIDRMVYVDLRGDWVDASRYDMEFGPGALARIVATLTVFPPPATSSRALILSSRPTRMPVLELGPGIGSGAPPTPRSLLVIPHPTRAACPVVEPSKLSHLADVQWSDLAALDRRFTTTRVDEERSVFLQAMRAGKVTHAEFIEERNPNGMFIRCLYLALGSTQLFHIAPFGEFLVWGQEETVPEWAELRKSFHVKKTNERIWLVRK